MANTISSLVVELLLEAKSFTNDLKASQKEAKAFEQSIKPTVAFANDMGVAMAAAGASIVGSFGLMVHQAAEYGDAIRDAAIRTGETTKEMSAMKYLAEQSGTSFEALQTGLKFLAKNAVAGADAFKQLGIDTKDTTGHTKSASDLFGEVSERLSKMEDGTEKTALMLKIFGKSGIELTEIMNGGKAGIDAAREATERFGTAIGPEAADRADVFNDKLNDMKQAQLGLSLAVGDALIPILTDAATFITDLIVDMKDLAAAHPALVEAVGGLGLALTGSGGLLLGLTGILTILPKLELAFTILTGPVGLTIAAISALVAGIIYFRQEIMIGLTAAFATAVQGFEYLLKAAASVADAVGPQGLVDSLNDAAKSVEKFRQGIDKSVVSQMAEYKQIPKTTTALAAEAAARKKSTTQAEDYIASQDKARKAAEAHSKAVKDQMDAMTNTSKADNTFVEALHALEKQGKLTTDVIMENKSKIEGLGNSNDDLVKKLQATILKTEETEKATRDAEKASADFLSMLVKLGSQTGVTLPGEMERTADAIDEIRSSMDIAAMVDMAGPINAGVQRIIDYLPALNTELDNMIIEMDNVGAAGDLMSLDMVNAAVKATEAHQKEIADYQEGEEKRVAAYNKHASDITAASNQMYSDLSSQALTAGNIVDSIFGGIHDGALTTGNVIRQLGIDVASGFLGPMKNAVNDLYKSFVDALFKPLTDRWKVMMDGWIDQLLEVIGLGSKATDKNAMGGTLGLGKSGAGPGIPGLGSGIMGFLTNPWTIGIGAAIGIGALWSKSQAHHEANTWVQNFQNPFDEMMAAIANSGGTAGDMAMLRSGAVADYLSAMQEFATHGKDEKLVANQAYRTFKQYYGEPASYGVEPPSLKTGMWNVPSDHFPAYLDRGEAVLPARQAERYRNGGGDIHFHNVTIHAAPGDSGKELWRKLRQEVRLNRDGIREDLQGLIGVRPA